MLCIRRKTGERATTSLLRKAFCADPELATGARLRKEDRKRERKTGRYGRVRANSGGGRSRVPRLIIKNHVAGFFLLGR